MKKKIILIIILVLFIILGVSYFGLSYFNKNNKKKAIEFKENIQELQKEEVSYMIVEINPKAILEVVNGKVVSKGCLNHDCINIFKDIDITDKDIKSALELMYNTAKEKGIDVKDGVKVSSKSEKIEEYVKEIEYVVYKNIDEEEEKKELEQVIDNETIKNEEKKESYSEKLLNEYKNDSDHGKLYTCSLVNDEVACYVTEDFDIELSKDLDSNYNLYALYQTSQKLERMLNKFDIKYDYKKTYNINNVTQIYINNEPHSIGSNYVSATTTIGIGIETETKVNEYKNTAIQVIKNDETYLLPITKLNLINLEYNDSDLIQIDLPNF